MDFNNIDFRKFQRYFSPQASEDLNQFLESMPANSSNTLLIVLAVTWAFAGATGLFATVQLQKLTELRVELQDAQAVQPAVPNIRNVAVSRQEVEQFVENTKNTYPNLSIKDSGSAVTIAAPSTVYFGQFREAIGHVQNGGSGWRVDIDKFCVGRECPREPLSITLKINKVSVTKAR